MVRHERVPGKPLSEDSRKELDALADVQDEEIDYSDIPATTEDDWKDAVRGPILPLELRTVTLAIDAEVYAWLETEELSNASLINFVLKREAQRQKKRTSSPSKKSSTMSRAS